MGSFVTIRNEALLEALRDVTRQYLVGNLTPPQAVEHVHDERLEVGLTLYDKPVAELPHWQAEATEYQYVISGWTQYLDTSTGVSSGRRRLT